MWIYSIVVFVLLNRAINFRVGVVIFTFLASTPEADGWPPSDRSRITTAQTVPVWLRVLPSNSVLTSFPIASNRKWRVAAPRSRSGLVNRRKEAKFLRVLCRMLFCTVLLVRMVIVASSLVLMIFEDFHSFLSGGNLGIFRISRKFADLLREWEWIETCVNVYVTTRSVWQVNQLKTLILVSLPVRFLNRPFKNCLLILLEDYFVVSYGKLCHIFVFIKGKAIPLQALTGPEGSRKLLLQDFKTIGTWRW
jgi:hypothetical protein